MQSQAKPRFDPYDKPWFQNSNPTLVLASVEVIATQVLHEENYFELMPLGNKSVADPLDANDQPSDVEIVRSRAEDIYRERMHPTGSDQT